MCYFTIDQWTGKLYNNKVLFQLLWRGFSRQDWDPEEIGTPRFLRSLDTHRRDILSPRRNSSRREGDVHNGLIGKPFLPDKERRINTINPTQVNKKVFINSSSRHIVCPLTYDLYVFTCGVPILERKFLRCQIVPFVCADVC